MKQTLIAYRLSEQRDPSPDSIVFARPDNDWYISNLSYTPVGSAHITIETVPMTSITALPIDALKTKLKEEGIAHSARVPTIVNLLKNLQGE